MWIHINLVLAKSAQQRWRVALSFTRWWVLTLIFLKLCLPTTQSHQISSAFTEIQATFHSVGGRAHRPWLMLYQDLTLWLGPLQWLQETKHALFTSAKKSYEASKVIHIVLTLHDNNTLEFSKYSQRCYWLLNYNDSSLKTNRNWAS